MIEVRYVHRCNRRSEFQSECVNIITSKSGYRIEFDDICLDPVVISWLRRLSEAGQLINCFIKKNSVFYIETEKLYLFEFGDSYYGGFVKICEVAGINSPTRFVPYHNLVNILSLCGINQKHYDKNWNKSLNFRAKTRPVKHSKVKTLIP